jgi:hypothetical protein
MSFKRNGWRILSGFFVLVLLGTAMMPCVAAMPGGQASGMDLKNVISIESITLSPDSSSTEFAASSVAGASTSTFESGAFTMTYLQANGNARKQTVTGRYSETRNKDGSSYTRITSEGVVYELSMKPVDQVEDGTLWEIEETRTTLGKSTTTVDTVVIPSDISTDTRESGSLVTMAAKRKVDVPSSAPSGTFLILNDVNAGYILDGGVFLGAVAAACGVPAFAIVSAVCTATEKILMYNNISSYDVYVDIYYWYWGVVIYQPIYAEVDYYYI